MRKAGKLYMVSSPGNNNWTIYLLLKYKYVRFRNHNTKVWEFIGISPNHSMEVKTNQFCLIDRDGLAEVTDFSFMKNKIFEAIFEHWNGVR